MTIFDILAAYSDINAETMQPKIVDAPRCQAHFEHLPCARCDEDTKRGYAVMTLAGRCANGSELDHGTRWHAVRPGEYKAICGAEPGRRSAGWSSYTVLGQPATCPRCVKKIERDALGDLKRAAAELTAEDIAQMQARCTETERGEDYSSATEGHW